MDEYESKRIVKILLLSWIFIIVLVGALAILVFWVFNGTSKTINDINTKIAIMQNIKQAQGLVGKDGLSIIGPIGPQGEQGIPGNNGLTTIIQETVQGQTGQQGIQGKTGEQGIPGISPRQIEFDGNGHWKYSDDDEWQPLIKAAL